MHASFVLLMHIDASAFSNARFGRGSGQILLDDVQCTGSEGRLIDCRYDSYTYDCGRYEDAGVHCQGRDMWFILIVHTSFQ